MSEPAADSAARADWFERAHAANAPPQAPELPESWLAALGEMRVAFCAGAWAATIVLAYALAEAAQRRAPSDDPEFDWLRERRNLVAHIDSNYPDAATLESDARGAVRAALRFTYVSFWR
ncbi:MAG: hypothetical protein GC202_05865 [Alphaproteobacteria bacterium]|nr:hypothetical protein [Alphaproteobacteria bacterium]